MEDSASLDERLARLALLETQFQQTLETEKLEAMAEFAAGAGHEINNPLTVISGRAQLLMRDEPDPERRHALALISAQAVRVYEMIADMMLFARPPKPERAAVELIGLVDTLIADMTPRCDRQEIGLSRKGDPGPLHCNVDPAQINVALRAICQNAIEAIGSGGHIEIHVERIGEKLAIRIRDDGPGMKPEERRHAFDPYYSARQAGRGLGLGLSKAWRIITNHAGRIDIESQPDHGATVTIAIPLSSPLPPGEG